MGEVFLAEHRARRVVCAVKVLRAWRRADPVSLRRLEREVRATAAFSHPSIVRILDAGSTGNGSFFYAMEYVPGVSLTQLVERGGALPATCAIDILVQLCGALHEAHGKRFVHRDINPRNALVRDGEPLLVKLLDFGLVLVDGADDDDTRLTRDGIALGTPAFMSPEQCAGERNLGPASDSYSLGALGYFLLTTQPVFALRSAARVLAAHLCREPPPMADHGVAVVPALEAVIRRCLETEPERRFASARALRAALRRVRRGGAACSAA